MVEEEESSELHDTELDIIKQFSKKVARAEVCYLFYFLYFGIVIYVNVSLCQR